jgi:hypothetical protein
MASNISNFLMRGKLGDFIQSLSALKRICESTESVANLYMYDDERNIGWEHGIENTYSELYDILINQDYIKSFNILDDFSTVQQLKSEEGYIDLGDFINSPALYQAAWIEIFSETFKFPIVGEYKWIDHKFTDPRFENKLLIHSRSKYGLNESFPYQKLIEENKGNNIFISTSENDYNSFPFKNDMEFYKIDSMKDWYTSINSCGLFVSNISAPACIANSLDVQRIIDLPRMIDSVHWIYEAKYTPNLFYYLDEKRHNLT